MINITLHEFKMIRDNYHPDYTSSDDSLGDFYEEGKGSDSIYKKEVIRKSDNKVFVLKTIYNTSGGFIHDDPYDCDFEIDYEKEDTIDPYNELKLEERKKNKLIEEEKRLKDIESKEKAASLVKFSNENPIIPFEEYKDYSKAYATHFVLNKKISMDELNIFIEKFVSPLCEKYNLEKNSLFHSLSSLKSKTEISKWLCKYERIYNKATKTKKVITLKGKEIELTEREVSQLKSQLDNKI